MTLLLLFGTVGLMTLPALTRPFSWRLPPAEWVRISAVPVVTGAALLEVALILCAIPALSQLPEVGHFFGSHHERHFFPGGEPVGWVSLLAAIAIPLGGLNGFRRARRQQKALRVEPWLGQHFPNDEFELVVLPTAGTLAIAVPGIPPQVVLSRGLISALSPRQLQVVVSHEAAHIRSKHSRYLLVAAAIEGAFWFIPTVKNSLATLRLALECSADRASVANDQDNLVIRSALLKLTETGGSIGVAAFGMAESLQARLRALEVGSGSSTRYRLATYVVGLGLLIVAFAPLTSWMNGG